MESARANPPPNSSRRPHCTFCVSSFHVMNGLLFVRFTLPQPPLTQHTSGNSPGHMNIDITTNMAAVPSDTYLQGGSDRELP